MPCYAEPGGPAARLGLLRCAALAAQLLAHSQRGEPGWLPLDALHGHGATRELAVAALRAFARLAATGADTGGASVARAAPTAAGVVEGARLEAVRAGVRVAAVAGRKRSGWAAAVGWACAPRDIGA